MTLPKPVVGLVVKYDYLWAREHRRGRSSSKDRPCCIIVTVAEGATIRVRYLAITHSQPRSDTDAVEIPQEEKLRLGLDDLRSFVVVTECNDDDWPFGLALRSGTGRGVVYGMLSKRFMRVVAAAFLESARRNKGLVVERAPPDP